MEIWIWGIPTAGVGDTFLAGSVGLLPHDLLPLAGPCTVVSLRTAHSGSTGLFSKKKTLVVLKYFTPGGAANASHVVSEIKRAC